MITTAKFSNKFVVPLHVNTFLGSPQKFTRCFMWSKQSLRHSKEFPGKLEKSGEPNIVSLISSVSEGSFALRIELRLYTVLSICAV